MAGAGSALELGPLDEPTRKRFSRTVSPISQALRRLGARRSLGEDEFKAVGLDCQRRNEDWISSACQGWVGSAVKRSGYAVRT